MNNTNTNPILDDKWLRWANFWVLHRERARKYALIFVIVIESLIIAGVVISLLNIYVFSANKNSALLSELTTFQNYKQLHSQLAPKPIPAPSVTLLPAGQEVDSAVLIKFNNPNEKWIAYVNYTLGDKQYSTVVLNKDSRFALVSGVSTSKVTVQNVTWRRIRNIEDFEAKRPNLKAENINYLNSEDDSLPGQVTFTLKNDSIYSFWEAEVMVLLMQGERAIGVRQLHMKELKAFEERNATINIYTSGSITNVQVVPFVDFSNPASLIPAIAPDTKF